MRTAYLKRIFTLTLAAFLVITTLYYCDQRNYAGNLIPFERNYETTPLKAQEKMLLSFEPGEILDMPSKDIFLINSKTGQQLYWIDKQRNVTIEYHPSNIKAKYDRITAAWFSRDTLFVINGNGRTLLKKPGFPAQNNTETVVPLGFTAVKGLPFGGSKSIVRKMTDSTPGCRLAIYDAASNTLLQDRWAKDQFNDDCLSTDGTIANDGHGGIYYVNLYNSRLIRFDSLMNLVFENNTIDKTKTLPSVKFDSANKSYNFFSPHRIKNYASVADSNFLYILSVAGASNDLNSVFNNNSPLDVYDAKTGAYIKSYHLEGVNINSVNGIQVKGNAIYLLSGKELNIFHYK